MTHAAPLSRDMTPERENGQSNGLDAAMLARAHIRLAEITAYFQENGPVSEKTHDDLWHELDSQNVWAIEEYPGEEAVSLLELLQASTARLQAAPDHSDCLHIHHLIECAFLEQEAHRAINALWRETRSNELTPDHMALIEAATRDYLSDYGREQLQALAEGAAQKERLPDYRASPYLQYVENKETEDDQERKAAFLQALRYVEAITDQLLEVGLWEKTPADFVLLLAEQNAKGRQEAEQQGKSYIETTLTQLQDISRRRLLAFADTGWDLTQYGRVIRFMDTLLQQALPLAMPDESPISSSPTLKSTGLQLSDNVAVAK